MKLYISILFSILLFIGNSIAQSGITVNINIPKEINAKETVHVELEIQKPEGMNSYAFFKQVIPSGFSVKAGVLNGADFKFENNELIITWLRLPTAEKVNASWEMTVQEGTLGNYEFSGSFNYLIDNLQGTIELDKSFVKAVHFKDHFDTEENRIGIVKLRNEVLCKRNVEYNESKKYYVIEIKINSKIEGAFSIVEKIPEGYTFKEFENSGAVLKTNKSNIQFLIRDIHPGKEYALKYLLIPKENTINKKPFVYGKLSFIADRQIINVSIVDK